MVDRSNYPVRKRKLGDESPLDDFVPGTMAERIAMVWQITVDAWAMKDPDAAQRRLPRHVVRVERRGG